ncbi:MAG: hypothetical protein KME07_06525 [Pegethrix bostrychoides GSE-TBD4-15B]|uniref:Uncharacterized protein n=1 Tax=Pegethrix bostrychoides GSE-TBD4-15B TaxID=2839662 RepID=A0A951P9Z5_9CYAN|nr:hypothetical protein [Pegethrix bostrychoides GSE-TBD4-15B]
MLNDTTITNSTMTKGEEASRLIESLSISCMTTARKYLMLEATARKMRTGESLQSALRAIDSEAEYVPVEIECLIFPYGKDEVSLLGLLFALILSKQGF